jgi:hypothetical protein
MYRPYKVLVGLSLLIKKQRQDLIPSNQFCQNILISVLGKKSKKKLRVSFGISTFLIIFVPYVVWVILRVLKRHHHRYLGFCRQVFQDLYRQLQT